MWFPIDFAMGNTDLKAKFAMDHAAAISGPSKIAMVKAADRIRIGGSRHCQQASVAQW